MPESRQLVTEYELPAVQAVPAVKAYRYIKASDTVAETARSQAQVKALYASAVAQIAVRTVHELLNADADGHIDTVVFNGVVDTTDPGTGLRVRSCLVTLRTTRDVFGELDLSHVQPLACLKHLSAAVSKSPAELVPVRPVLEFSMVDPRFVAESDAPSGLDQRPNLMELTPTRVRGPDPEPVHRDGARSPPDASLARRRSRLRRLGPAADLRRKVVIQAKRYKNTVGVSAAGPSAAPCRTRARARESSSPPPGTGRPASSSPRTSPSS